MTGKFAIAIHGGAGTIGKDHMTPEKEKEHKEALKAALQAGYEVLKRGASSIEAVEAAVMSLEDCPLFNAGKGAVFNHEGKHEMDAAIMEGQHLHAGSICSVKNVRNPISLAKAILKSKQVTLSGAGAEEFAKANGLRFEPDEYFFVAMRHEQWKEAIKNDVTQLDHAPKKYGTVGAVALDVQGNLAAATSTGGLTNKRYGRIGDSPIIGAGTYANNATCAISCTGEGEFFIRAVAAYDVSCLIEYKGLTLKEAADKVVLDKLVRLKGEGGLIAINQAGEIAMPFNSEGMYRASIDCKGNEEVLIF